MILKEGITPEIIARAYNLNEIYTESNIISMGTVEYVPMEEDLPTIQISTEEKKAKELKQKVLTFLLIVMIILLICFVSLLIMYIVKEIRHSKRRKQRRIEERKRRR